MEDNIEEIIEVLGGLINEGSVPKNVKEKIKLTINVLKEDTEVKIRVNKALSELDEISDDPNLEAYTRTQIWNVVSLLEKNS